jgi:hypothetical protein
MRHDNDSLSSTTFSLSPSVPKPPERRQATRQLATFRVGKLVIGRSQELCLIRNISSGGLMAHVYSTRKVGERLSIELKSDQQVTGEIVWLKGSNIGVKFDAPVELEEVLGAPSRAIRGWRARSPRVEIEARARLRVGARYHRVTIRDLSQGGVKVEMDELPATGEEVVVTIEGLEPVKGVVRWQTESCAGISFNQPIPFTALTRWLGIRTSQPA